VTEDCVVGDFPYHCDIIYFLADEETKEKKNKTKKTVPSHWKFTLKTTIDILQFVFHLIYYCSSEIGKNVSLDTNDFLLILWDSLAFKLQIKVVIL